MVLRRGSPCGLEEAARAALGASGYVASAALGPLGYSFLMVSDLSCVCRHTAARSMSRPPSGLPPSGLRAPSLRVQPALGGSRTAPTPMSPSNRGIRSAARKRDGPTEAAMAVGVCSKVM